MQISKGRAGLIYLETHIDSPPRRTNRVPKGTPKLSRRSYNQFIFPLGSDNTTKERSGTPDLVSNLIIFFGIHNQLRHSHNERKGKERKGKERKGKERKGKRKPCHQRRIFPTIHRTIYSRASTRTCKQCPPSPQPSPCLSVSHQHRL